MKMTLDIPDEVLRQAEALAERRGMTVAALAEHALRQAVCHAPPDEARSDRIQPVVVGQKDDWIAPELRAWEARDMREQANRRARE